MSRVNPRLVYWIAALYDHKELTAADRDRLVFLATTLLDYWTGAGECSARTVAAEMGQGESTVLGTLRRAGKAGVLEQTRQGGRRGHAVIDSGWQIVYPALPPTAQKRAVGPSPNRSDSEPQPLRSDAGTVSYIDSQAAAARTTLLDDLNAKARAETGDGEFTPATKAEWQAWCKRLRSRPNPADPRAVAGSVIKHDRAAELVEEIREVQDDGGVQTESPWQPYWRDREPPFPRGGGERIPDAWR